MLSDNRVAIFAVVAFKAVPISDFLGVDVKCNIIDLI